MVFCMYAKSYRDLLVYKKASKLAQENFEITRAFPAEERYSLTNQARRSSRSVGAQIAEAWAKRRYKAHFISKLTDADGEQQETQHWLNTALDCGYLKQSKHDEMISRYSDIGRMINGMIAKAKQFCSSSVKEPAAEFFTDN